MKKRDRRCDYRSTGSDRLDRILNNIREIWYVISGTLIISVEPEERAKTEKRRKRIIWSIVALTLLSILLIIGIPWIKYYNTIIKQQISNTDALQFISTFWGAIIGALLAASLTIISTWMIINRSYRVDFHRDRIDHMPVLCLHEIKGAVLDKDGIKLPSGATVWSEQQYQFSHKYNEISLNKVIEISNIGSGIALNISSTSGFYEGRSAFFAGISTKDVTYLLYSACTEIPEETIKLWFSDIFGNKYVQEFNYELNEEYDMYFVGGSIPTLFERTKRIRYTQ